MTEQTYKITMDGEQLRHWRELVLETCDQIKIGAKLVSELLPDGPVRDGMLEMARIKHNALCELDDMLEELGNQAYRKYGINSALPDLSNN